MDSKLQTIVDNNENYREYYNRVAETLGEVHAENRLRILTEVPLVMIENYGTAWCVVDYVTCMTLDVFQNKDEAIKFCVQFYLGIHSGR